MKEKAHYRITQKYIKRSAFFFALLWLEKVWKSFLHFPLLHFSFLKPALNKIPLKIFNQAKKQLESQPCLSSSRHASLLSCWKTLSLNDEYESGWKANGLLEWRGVWVYKDKNIDGKISVLSAVKNRAINRGTLKNDFNAFSRIRAKFHKQILWHCLRSFFIIISQRMEGWVFRERWVTVSMVARTNYKFPESVIRRSKVKLYH